MADPLKVHPECVFVQDYKKKKISLVGRILFPGFNGYQGQDEIFIFYSISLYRRKTGGNSLDLDPVASLSLKTPPRKQGEGRPVRKNKTDAALVFWFNEL